MTFSFLQTVNEMASQADLKQADRTSAGASDVINKVHSTDVEFTNMRNAINAEGGISGSDIADYIEQAEALNDEVDTIAYGLETADGHIVKVYVNATQGDDFEIALQNMLGVEEDIEDSLNRLAGSFDIVDVIWPKDAATADVKSSAEDDGVEGPQPGDSTVDIENVLSGNIPPGLIGMNTEPNSDDDDEDDDYEVIAALPGMDQTVGNNMSASETSTDVDPDTLPEIPATEDGDIWSKLNDLAIEKFGQDDDSTVLGIADLSVEQLDELIDLAKADEIAVNEYEAADFASLDEDEQREVLAANPDLVRDDASEEEEDSEEEEVDAVNADSPDPAGSNIPESKFSFLSSLNQLI